MFTPIRCRRILIGALAGAALTVLSVSVASSQARKIDVRELTRSTPRAPVRGARTGRDLPGKSRSPKPRLTRTIHGWRGTQFVTRRHRKAAYETVGLLWRDRSGSGILILSGPAMTLSPAATIAGAQRSNWSFAPYDPPGPVQRWAVDGRQAANSTRPLRRPASGRSSAVTRPRLESFTIARFAWRRLVFAGRRWSSSSQRAADSPSSCRSRSDCLHHSDFLPRDPTAFHSQSRDVWVTHAHPGR